MIGSVFETEGKEPLEEKLRRALSAPLPNWRDVYDCFRSRDLETGEQRRRVPVEDARRAAVLVPILRSPAGPRVVYTLRTDGLRDHAGQVSFPGGSVHPGDASLLETALREAEEEVDLRRDLIEVVGELEDMYVPPSRFLVKPFVALLPPEAELVLAPDEVEAIFSVRLEELMSPESLRTEVWEREGRRIEVPLFAVGGHEIWGATAAMTANLLVRLGWDTKPVLR